MGERKSRAEWSKLVAGYRASGESAERFAARRGVVARTLRWWAWRLAQDDVRVLPVVVREGSEGAVTASGAAQVVELAVGDVRLRFEVGADARYMAGLVAELRVRC